MGGGWHDGKFVEIDEAAVESLCKRHADLELIHLYDEHLLPEEFDDKKVCDYRLVSDKKRHMLIDLIQN